MIGVRRPLTRQLPVSYGDETPWGGATWRRGSRPAAGGALAMFPLPVGVNGQPYFGMDPSAPATYVRPWNPQPGMIARLNFDGAKLQGNTPMGGTWRNPQRDRADVRPRHRRGRRHT